MHDKTPSSNHSGGKDYTPLVILDEIRSNCFGKDNPPTDWADLSLLLPHEALRREMDAMRKSVEALRDHYDDSPDKTWRVLYFCEWYIDSFHIMVEDHHEAEEKIFFPWIATRATIPSKEMGICHDSLIKMMGEIKIACENIVAKKGLQCSVEIASIKEKTPRFVSEMEVHFLEEEESLCHILRENFTEKEHDAILHQILRQGGLEIARVFLPSIMSAVKEWGTSEFYEMFVADLPGPIRSLALNYYIPDYENVVCPSRDSPLLDKKPMLSKAKCCLIPFCWPCII